MLTLSFEDTSEMLESFIDHNDNCAKENASPNKFIVPFIVGTPGTGKSAMVKYTARKKGRDAKVVILAQYDPAELAGYVYRDGGYMRKSRPDYLPEGDDNTMLFLDEFSQSQVSLQNIATQLVYDRCVGVHKQSLFSSTVVAGNGQSDRAGTTPWVKHFLNRVSVVGQSTMAEEWLDMAMRTEMHPLVVGFIQTHKLEALNQYNPQSDSNPTPRSWEFTSSVLKMGMRPALQNAAVNGFLGDSMATKFKGYIRTVGSCPDPQDIIRNPTGTPVLDEPELVYATISALMGHANDRTAGPIIQYLDRLDRKEFCVFAVRYMHMKDKSLMNNKHITAWMSKNAGLFINQAQ